MNVDDIPDRDRLVRALFDRAVDLNPEEWASFLGLECPDDPGLRDVVRRLLEGSRQASEDGFLMLPDGPAEADPERIGKYQIVRRFRQKSGQAAAYLAFDPDLARHVVLKRYKDWDTDEDRRAMAEEGRALARVRSPFVAQCFGIERHDDGAFLVVEYVSGRNLAEVRHDGPIEAARVAAILGQLAEGAAAVHACGLIHRDIKPANVILGDDDRPRLVDFGLAAPLGSDRLRDRCGSPRHMAPEQARGEAERIDQRTDVFGLGAVLYELLTGHPPYEGGSLEEALDQASKADFAPPGRSAPETPAWLEGVCLRALAKAPENRYSTALELAEALRRGAEGPHPGGDRASAVPQDRGRRPSRTPLAAAAAAGFLARDLRDLAVNGCFTPLAAAAATGLLVLALALSTWYWPSRSGPPTQSPPSKTTPSGPLRAEVVVDHFEDLGDGKHVRPLSDQGKHAEAEAMFRRALATDLEARGEGHPDTAGNYNNLGWVLREQGKHAEAEAMFRRDLAIRLKALGEGHPDTAASYHNLGWVLREQGKHAEAEAMYRRALVIRLKALGEGHPDTAGSYRVLAEILDCSNKPEEALHVWEAAAESYEKARYRATKGFETDLTAGDSPLPSVAVALARAGRSGDAWTRWEQGLARGILDEVAGRALRPLTAEEKDRENESLSRSQATDERIDRLLGQSTRTQEEDRQLDELRRQESDLRRRSLDNEHQLEAKYGALAGKPAGLEEVRRAIPERAALVGWVDAGPHHWACVLRRTGDPTWVRLPGSGPGGDWTKDDEDLPRRLRQSLDPEVARGDGRALAGALARQRLGPLAAHLEGVRHLIVLTSPGMAGVPVEVLVAARGGPRRDDPVVSYAPSASMLAHLIGKKKETGPRPATLLAVGDPAYPDPRPDPPAARPPDGGIVLARVEPFENADLNGLRAGDVLLEYAGQALRAPDDLRVVAADAGPRKVPVKFWREGDVRSAEVAAGPLGVALDARAAAPVVLARREADRVLRGTRGATWTRLPGTRREVEAIAGLFPAGGVTTLLGERARESVVQELTRAGRLRDFRFLHFATHGQSDPRNAYRSSLILAPDADRSSDPEAFEADGVITADQIARTWDLDADLVVLSACESGLGRLAGGEGYLGFAQALFAKGARSLVLSLWKVDDDVTALLMTRFYQNLLGRRMGLAAPLPKAEALAEAKRWLREATDEEAGAALAELPRPRGEIVRREPAPRGPVNRPYEDPTYWSGFILVGNPD